MSKKKSRYSNAQKRAYWIGYGIGLQRKDQSKADHAIMDVDEKHYLSFQRGNDQAIKDSRSAVRGKLNGRKKMTANSSRKPVYDYSKDFDF